MKQIELVYNGMYKDITIKVNGKEVSRASMPTVVIGNSEYINLTSVKNAFNQINLHEQKNEASQIRYGAKCGNCRHLRYDGKKLLCQWSPIKYWGIGEPAIEVKKQWVCPNWVEKLVLCCHCKTLRDSDEVLKVGGDDICKKCVDKQRVFSRVEQLIKYNDQPICYNCLTEIKQDNVTRRNFKIVNSSLGYLVLCNNCNDTKEPF